jgi:predicted nucleotidyltransferase
MRRDALSLRAIADVAELLGDLRVDVVFVGGATIPLLVTDEAAGADRPTDDVDVVVEATSPVTYYAFTEKLRARGFSEDQRDEPPVICRWKHGHYRVDVMPVEGTFMGFRGAWFRAVCDRSWSVEVRTGVTVRVARAPELLATKAEAFEDRGRRDFVASKDVEDFLSVVNGRPELLDELREAPPEVRGYVSDTVAAWLRDNDFMEALPGQLAGDDASQARVSVLVARLRSIAELPR